MLKNDILLRLSNKRHPVLSIVSLSLFVFGGLIVLGGLLAFIGIFLFSGLDLTEAGHLMQTAQTGDSLVLLIVQAGAAIGGFILTPLLYLKYAEQISFVDAWKGRPVTLLVVGLTLLITFSMMIVNSAVIEWNMSITFPDFMAGFEQWLMGEEEKRKVLTERLIAFESWPISFVTLFVIAVLPALGEELLFRGAIQNYLYKATHHIHWAIWISAVIFGAIHMQFYGMFPRILLGALFGYLYFWSGNLWVPILAHFFNNAFSLLMYQLYQQDVIDINVDETESAPWYMVLLMLVVLIMTMGYFKRLNVSEPSMKG